MILKLGLDGMASLGLGCSITPFCAALHRVDFLHNLAVTFFPSPRLESSCWIYLELLKVLHMGRGVVEK